MTGPVPQPADREALAAFLLDAHNEAINNDGWPDGVWLTVADKLLARWWLVPVEQEHVERYAPGQKWTHALTDKASPVDQLRRASRDRQEVADAVFILGWLEGSHPGVYAEALIMLRDAREQAATSRG